MIRTPDSTMTDSDFTYTVSLGTHRQTTYSIGVRLDPTIDNVESFAAVLFFELQDGTRIQIAKVDNTPHRDHPPIHVDRYYREPGRASKDFDTHIDTWMDAEAYLRDNWQRFVQTYRRNYGDTPRPDDKNT